MPAIPADPAYGWLNTSDMPYIDYLCLMIYGGPGADKIGTSLSTYTSAINKFLNAGYPAAKLLAGVPVYTDDSADWFGAYYQLVQQFNPATSLNQISKSTANGLTNWQIANNKTVNGGILYFNGADLMVSKTQWAMDKSLGGIYLWIINWDAAPGSPNSLLDVIYKTLGGSQMGQVNFTGVVSAQSGAGEQITVTITKPGGGTSTISGITDSTRAYSIVYSDVAGTGYKAVASIAADADYSAATSPSVTFDIGKATRTITLSVG
jgi:hypothetical protein